MVTVVTTTAPPTTDMNIGGGPLGSIFGFLGNNWIPITIIVIIIAVIVMVFVLWMKKDEERKEQEDMLYKAYKDDIRNAFKNQDPKMYTKKYSWWNWIFLFLPIIKKKVGGPVYDFRQNFIGYYDGMFIDMLGNQVIMVWKDKIWFIFKDHFILRVPQKYYTLTQVEVKKKKGQEDQPERFETKINVMDLPKDLVIIPDPTHTFDKSIIIRMINIVRRGFYYYPILLDPNEKILDLTACINALNHINSSSILLEQVIKESGKNVVNMAKVNTNLVYEQRKPEKVREVKKDDDENQ